MADYATIAEVKGRVDKTTTSPDWDTYGPTVITGVSRAIDAWANRPDGFIAETVASARTYAGNGRARMRIDECIEITLVEVKDSVTDSSYTSWAATDWIAFTGDPVDPDFNSLPYDWLMVDASGDYGVFTSGVIGSGSYKDRFFAPEYGVNERLFYNPRNVHAQATVRITAKWGYAETVPPAIKEACCMETARVLKRYEGAQSNILANTEFGELGYEVDPEIQLMLKRFKKPGGIGRR